MRETRKLRVYLGRVIRDIRRKAGASGMESSEAVEQYLQRADRIFQQKREDKNKVYSMHAPEVECISKGKKKYELGCKVPSSDDIKEQLGSWSGPDGIGTRTSYTRSKQHMHKS